jgi:hypothetical protein
VTFGRKSMRSRLFDENKPDHHVEINQSRPETITAHFRMRRCAP